MAAKTEAQEEFDAIISKASASERLSHHPSDTNDYKHDKETSDRDEEEEYTQNRIDENMRMPVFDRGGSGGTLHLPHRDFDNGRTTGVKGVIADARSYEEARRTGSWRNKFSRGSSGTRADKRVSTATFLKDDGEGSASEDEAFIERWRQSRRDELLKEGNDIRNRRTSPSVRRYGRFDEVDAMGYLDAIEKVTRETVVVVFVYDPEVCRSLVSPRSAPLLTPTVRRLTSYLRCALTPRSHQPHPSFRPSPLRRHRIRPCRRSRHPSIQKSRGPLCKLNLHHRADPR
jgi:hypothetical protein